MATSTRITFGLFASAIKSDATFVSAASLQAFSRMIDLQAGNVNARPYATYEPDFWLLDGGYKFLPDDLSLVHVGLMSLGMSDASGVLASPVVLEITFTQAHTTDGLGLRFSPYTGDYASSVKVQWYDAADSLISEATYTPDSAEYAISGDFEDFKRVVLTFYGTLRPHRYLRVQGVDFGTLLTLEGASIKGARVVEECAPLSDELRANVLELQLHSDDAQFSILNPEGDYAALATFQPINVYALVDNTQRFIGQYFVTDWENQSETEISFDGIDLIGVLDQIACRGGLWTGAGIPVEDLLQAWLEAASIPYELDAALVGSALIGWVPAGSLRDAVQQVAFAVGASVTTSRAWALRISATKIAADETAELTITRAMKSAQQAVRLRVLVADVEVTAHSYLAGTQARDLLNDTLDAGTYEVLFDRPMHSLSASGATITESGANYAVLTVAAPGAVTLAGQEYVDTTQLYRLSNPAATSSVRPTLRVTDATLVHPGNVADVAQRVYDYTAQRVVQKVRLYKPALEVGQVATIETLYGKQIRALCERMEIDLGRGMVADADLIGVEVVP